MGVLKREQLQNPRAFSFADVESEARDIVAAARAQAAALQRETEQQRATAQSERKRFLAETQRLAQQRAKEIEAEARERGFQEGHAAGEKQVRAETHAQALQHEQANLQRTGAMLVEALTTFEKSKWALLGAAEQGVVALALAIAQRICHTAAAKTSEVALAQARQLIANIQYEHDLELRVAEPDFERLNEALPDFVQQTGRMLHVELIADPTLTVGDCLLRTKQGTIDARIPTQIQRVAEALLTDTSRAQFEAFQPHSAPAAPDTTPPPSPPTHNAETPPPTDDRRNDPGAAPATTFIPRPSAEQIDPANADPTAAANAPQPPSAPEPPSAHDPAPDNDLESHNDLESDTEPDPDPDNESQPDYQPFELESFDDETPVNAHDHQRDTHESEHEFDPAPNSHTDDHQHRS